MTREINRFVVEPSTSYRRLFRRVTGPRHEYIFYITPPAEMVARQPYLPRFMAGGLGNPLGARAIYLGGTMYHIHRTNQPSTIGGQVSSGCIRMVNEDVIELYGRVDVGSRVVVLPAEPHRMPRSEHIDSFSPGAAIARCGSPRRCVAPLSQPLAGGVCAINFSALR